MMANLLNETIERLADRNLKPSDVQWVGSDDGKFAVTWDEFAEKANFEYDDGYGSQEIASDLVVVGKDWWLQRHEYDGSEGWVFQTYPERTSENPRPIRILSARQVDEHDGTLAQLHDKIDKYRAL